MALFLYFIRDIHLFYIQIIQKKGVTKWAHLQNNRMTPTCYIMQLI